MIFCCYFGISGHFECANNAEKIMAAQKNLLSESLPSGERTHPDAPQSRKHGILIKVHIYLNIIHIMYVQLPKCPSKNCLKETYKNVFVAGKIIELCGIKSKHIFLAFLLFSTFAVKLV